MLTKHLWLGIAVFAVVFVGATPATADWDPTDGHKMHWPQTPNPNGWDIDLTTDTIYDDFKCSSSGPINDVHFWVSWQGDNTGEPNNISWIDIAFITDVPAVVGQSFSHPDTVMSGNPLWIRRFLPGEFTSRHAGSGDQGWAEPQNGIWNRPDHAEYYQINIDEILEPFIQQKDEIYWLGIHIGVEDFENTKIGWKTSLDHWNDDATYYLADAQNPEGWRELIDPDTGTSLDMAFVITPEPTTMSLLALGGLVVLRRRRKQ